MQKHYAKVFCCDGPVAGGRLELRPPVESSDLDEKVLPGTPVQSESGLRFNVTSQSKELGRGPSGIVSTF
jgi:hypothetical protein